MYQEVSAAGHTTLSVDHPSMKVLLVPKAVTLVS